MTRFDAEVWICNAQAKISASSGGSAPAGNTTVTQNSSPWTGQQPYIAGEVNGTDSNLVGNYFNAGQTIPGTNITPPGAGEAYTASGGTGTPGIFPEASALYQDYTPQYYNGDTYAAFNPTQTSALSSIENQASTGEPITQAAMGFNSGLENGNYLNSNPATSLFQSLGSTNLGTSASTPGVSSLESLANGQIPSSLLSSVESSVVPQLEASANSGNAVNNPATANAVGAGLGQAFAPYMENAASTLESGALSGGNLQATADTGLSNPYQETLQNMTQGVYAAPSTQQLAYNDYDQAFNAGSETQQNTQQQTNADINEWNYNQLLPYNELDTYAGDVNGSYGSSSLETQPYYENGTANTLGTVGGLLGLGSSAASLYGLLGTGAAAGATSAGADAATMAALSAFAA